MSSEAPEIGTVLLMFSYRYNPRAAWGLFGRTITTLIDTGNLTWSSASSRNFLLDIVR